jgi:cytosine permease
MVTTIEHRIPQGEYQHEPVAAAHRKSTASVVSACFSFPVITTNVVFGSVIAYNLGFRRAIKALINGNTILLLFVGAV